MQPILTWKVIYSVSILHGSKWQNGGGGAGKEVGTDSWSVFVFLKISVKSPLRKKKKKNLC